MTLLFSLVTIKYCSHLDLCKIDMYS